LHEKRDTRSDFSELKKIHVEAKNFLGQNERKKKEGGGGGGGGGGCAGPRGLKRSLFRQWNCEKNKGCLGVHGVNNVKGR